MTAGGLATDSLRLADKTNQYLLPRRRRSHPLYNLRSIETSVSVGYKRGVSSKSHSSFISMNFPWLLAFAVISVAGKNQHWGSYSELEYDQDTRAWLLYSPIEYKANVAGTEFVL